MQRQQIFARVHFVRDVASHINGSVYAENSVNSMQPSHNKVHIEGRWLPVEFLYSSNFSYGSVKCERDDKEP